MTGDNTRPQQQQKRRSGGYFKGSSISLSTSEKEIQFRVKCNQDQLLSMGAFFTLRIQSLLLFSLFVYLQSCCQVIEQLRKPRLQGSLEAPRQNVHVFHLVAQQRAVLQRQQVAVVGQQLRLEQIHEGFER